MSEVTTSTPAPGAAGVSSLLGDDWPSQTADTIERLIGTVRSKTTEPVERIVRGIVYGLLAAVLGVVALVLLAIAAVRFVDAYLPGEVWAAHLLIGALFTAAGLLLWSRRRSTADRR